jgi:uncharacterized membrane-anchored protein
MTSTTDTTTPRDVSKFTRMLSKVPEVTLYVWILKILCTTVGETASDYLQSTVNLGLTITTVITGAVLIIALFFQFKARKYVPSIYWICVVLISVVGTQITDNLSDNLGVSLWVSTAAFSVCLAATFAVWYGVEKTLSIHSILTTRREAFYWLTILFTFALGTAAGDLMAEQLNLGYLLSVGIFAVGIIAVTIAYYQFKFNAVIAFWFAYILTRPLGASIGDYLSQAPTDGGLGLGTTVTSGIFLAAILALVIYLTVSKKDAPKLTVLNS